MNLGIWACKSRRDTALRIGSKRREHYKEKTKAGKMGSNWGEIKGGGGRG